MWMTDLLKKWDDESLLLWAVIEVGELLDRGITIYKHMTVRPWTGLLQTSETDILIRRAMLRLVS